MRDVRGGFGGGRGGFAISQHGCECGAAARTGGGVGELCRAFGVFFIVNDYPELAAEVGADGVHLGRTDVDLLSAREIVGAEAMIGASCGGAVERAERARSAGADYCAMGAVFPSPTKPEAERCSLSAIGEAKGCCDAPIVAIGGINAGNIAQTAAAGADMAAVISGLFGAEDIRKAAREMSAAFFAAATV